MWRPISRFLDFLGRARISYRSHRAMLTVGDPNDRDALDSMGWRDFLQPERLYDVWGPLAGSLWEPYHCVPLFAAVAAVKPDRMGPTQPDLVRDIEGNGKLADGLLDRPLGTAWAAARTWVILDLPGPTSVAAAVRLIRAGFQPVCTFDHWPHEHGLLKPERILAQLLRYAPLVAELRRELAPGAPPLWICDRDRLGSRPGRPREFDNRYFLDDSILPSAEMLRSSGISRILCVVPETGDSPREDLSAYFRDLRTEGFVTIQGLGWADASVAPFSFAEPVFQIGFRQAGFRRADAGGFGQLIPEPSSSGS